ncbi:YqaJ viral recombinase family protein [Variovorax sp. Varisp62]|uniref:YqaJ viral recombinase family nuclease n=1 Tax=Variovorax sp. Varisp62 TaxID=3243049 RepID=UPI0039B56377
MTNSEMHSLRRAPATPVRSRTPVLQLVQTTRAQPAILERWPNLREAGVGNLDAAAAVGRDPFKSQIRLWMEKTERQDLLQPVPNVPPLPDSAAYWNRLLEPIVAAHYTLRTGRQVRRTSTLMRHPQHPWMFAGPGREVVGACDVQLLECRCVGVDEAVLWAEGLPGYVQIQMLHQLAVADAKAIDVVALVGGQDLQIHRVERDEAEIARLIDAEREFWCCVELDQAPLARDGEALP